MNRGPLNPPNPYARVMVNYTRNASKKSIGPQKKSTRVEKIIFANGENIFSLRFNDFDKNL